MLRNIRLEVQDFKSPEGYTLAPAATRVVTFTVEHENAPEVYRNGHFTTATIGGCTVTGIFRL